MKSTVTKVAKATAIFGSLSGCVGTGLSDADPYIAAPAAGVFVAAITNAVTDDPNISIATGAAATYVTNVASNRARACREDTSLRRDASVDNLSGTRTYDDTNQSYGVDCTRYRPASPGMTGGGIVPIFRENTDSLPPAKEDILKAGERLATFGTADPSSFKLPAQKLAPGV